MKYIIDLPKEYTSKSSLFGEILSIPIQINGGKNYNIPTAIKIRPYTEPDRKAIEDEVWELVRLLINTNDSDLYEIFNHIDSEDVIEKMNYQEAKAKYEEWKKQKDEIRVGDEVEYVCCDETIRFVVTGINNGHWAYGFKYPCDYDESGEYCDLDQLRKTGRHFDEVAELLKKMKGEEE